MVERCACGADDWAVISGTFTGEVASVVCGSCGADAPGDVAAVLTAEHVLEAASIAAHDEQEAIAESAPDPPNWVQSPGPLTADAWADLRRRVCEPRFVELPQRDEWRDRRRSWTWGQALVAVCIIAFLIAFWAAVAAIVVEVVT